MSAPRYADCKCGHARTLHPERLEEACIADGCECEEYIPSTIDRLAASPVAAARTMRAVPDPEQPKGEPAGPDAASIEQVLQAGRRSPSKRTQALAEKIGLHLNALGARLDGEQEADKARRVREAEQQAARAKIERLQRELAAAKAELTGRTTEPGIATAGEHACRRADCDRSFATSQARAMHERRAHDGFDPHVARSAS